MKKKLIRRLGQDNPAISTSVHPLLRKIYSSRGIVSDEDLDLSLDQLLPPDSFLHMDDAVRLLADAIRARQKILIVGDFDADGATSSALMVRALTAMGAAHVDYLVPNRFEYGYGLTPEIVDVARSRQPDLIVTVDNGISSIEGVKHAKAHGIDVLITDHHLPGKELPCADAIVNPNQPGCSFASKSVAGVGVAFYVLSALRKHLRQQGWFADTTKEPNMASFLDLVALGTVADVVMLDKNNRILVHQGIRRIRAGKTLAGISALIKKAARNQRRLTAADLGFGLGPRLNAAGRLEDMSLGIECLLADDQDRANELAGQLEALNKERRAIESDMKDQAEGYLKELSRLPDQSDLPYGVCLFSPEWHQGVVGIVAARIKEKVRRPVFAFAPSSTPDSPGAADGELKGSGRSIAGFHIRDALENIAVSHPGLIDKFGGHAMAAGLSIRRAVLDQFKQAFAEEAARQLSEEDIGLQITSDGEIDECDFNLEFAELLRESGPWGQGFEEPVFDGHFEVIKQRLVGGRHLKLTLAIPGSKVVLDGIAFNHDQLLESRYQHIAYRLQTNEYAGRESLQIVVEEFDLVMN